MSDEQNINVNWVQALAGALAAMSSAVLLSTVGVAGTIIGAAVGSVIATVGSAIYSYYLETSKKRVAAASSVARERAVRARGRIKGASASSVETEDRTQQLDLAEEDLEQAEEDLEQAEEEETTEKPSWKEILRGLRWKRIGIATVGIFLLAMAAILAFELIAGRSVSTITGGSDAGKRSSISWGSGSGQEKKDEPSPEPTTAPSEAPGEPTFKATPTSPAQGEEQEEPSATPSEEPSEEESSAEPTPAPTPTPTLTPSEEPTP